MNYFRPAIAILVGAAAMQDQEYKNTCVARIKRSRSKLATSLQQIGFQVRDSQGNFLLLYF
jgi:histidinol-phosphate aminotransferase